MNDVSFKLFQQEAEILIKECGLYKDSIIAMKHLKSSNYPEIFDFNSYCEYVRYILSARDYDILLSDDSFFQFDKLVIGNKDVLRYVFMQNPIGSISFDDYCKKNDISDEEREDYRQIYEEDSDVQLIKEFPLYMRYDVDIRGYKPNLHSYAHLHIGVCGDARIPVRLILTPAAFVSLAIKMTFPENWKVFLNSPKSQNMYDFKNRCIKVENKNWDIAEDRDLLIT